MNKEALQKFISFFTHSKILLPGFLLLIAWIITIFTFYLYQTPNTSVEGLAIKKFSNLSPSPVTLPTPTVFFGSNERYISVVNPTVTILHQITTNSPKPSQSHTSSGKESSSLNNVITTPMP